MTRQPIRLLLAAALLLTPVGCGLTPCPVARCAVLFSEDILVPAKDATGVPLNARIWVARPFSKGGDLVVSTGGIAVEGTIRTLTPSFSEQGVQQFIPKAPLAVRAQYIVTVGGEEVSRFTTGADELAPLAPLKATVIDRHIPQNSCDSPSGTVQLEPAGALSLVVVAGQEGAFDADRADGSVLSVTASSTVTLSSGCGFWNGTDKVRFGTIDLAGRFSGWSEIF